MLMMVNDHSKTMVVRFIFGARPKRSLHAMLIGSEPTLMRTVQRSFVSSFFSEQQSPHSIVQAKGHCFLVAKQI